MLCTVVWSIFFVNFLIVDGWRDRFPAASRVQKHRQWSFVEDSGLQQAVTQAVSQLVSRAWGQGPTPSCSPKYYFDDLWYYDTTVNQWQGALWYHVIPSDKHKKTPKGHDLSGAVRLQLLPIATVCFSRWNTTVPASVDSSNFDNPRRPARTASSFLFELSSNFYLHLQLHPLLPSCFMLLLIWSLGRHCKSLAIYHLPEKDIAWLFGHPARANYRQTGWAFLAPLLICTWGSKSTHQWYTGSSLWWKRAGLWRQCWIWGNNMSKRISWCHCHVPLWFFRATLTCQIWHTFDTPGPTPLGAEIWNLARTNHWMISGFWMSSVLANASEVWWKAHTAWTASVFLMGIGWKWCIQNLLSRAETT